MKKAQRNSFKINPIAAAIAVAMTSQFSAHLAHAGAGFAQGAVRTYYANSPAGPATQLDASGASTIRADGSGLPVVRDTGKALRKFVDTLPGIPGITAASLTTTNNLGQYIPLAVAEKWVDLNGTTTTDEYYEIAAVEFFEKMHSDLSKPTRLRGYVQLSTAKNPGKHIALKYPSGAFIVDAKGAQVYAYDNPHHLGPIIRSAKGTAVRVKFSNYLPVGGELFLPVDSTITGAGTGPNGTPYTQNRASIRLVGGQAPWISAGSPHQWVAPAGETAAYAAGLGKGVSTQNVPDMEDPGPGATTLYFPNDMSARFMFYQDRTSGLTRLNSYAGLEAGYVVTDAAEAALVSSGTIPADQIPLIIEDKTFVPDNIAQQDAKWDTAHWGQPGDLWFPHVYETNQNPNSVDGANPAGRWDFGPWFWPIFPAKNPLPAGGYGDASFTPEAYLDTPVINGTAYPTLTVSPKAYRLRILNASNDRYINLGLFKADGAVQAPQLDQNGNPMVDASGNQLFFRNTEVKMVPAVGNAAGEPPGWDATKGVQLPLPKYPGLRTNINVESSGPSRAWPIDNRVGGAPDPTTAGPDFIVIGNDGGLLPNPVDVPAQPVTYEANRRSITVGNIYGYGLLLGPAERADAIVDFSQYAGQTLILYNDAPAPAPFMDTRNDYFTGSPDQSAFGGAYTTQPGYGPNTRTMMQINVSNNGVARAYDPTPLLTALPAAYQASQSLPIVPAVAYNAAFGTNDPDIYAHVATGTSVQPKLTYSTSSGGLINLTGFELVTSGGTVTAGGAIVGNPRPGSGTGYDPESPPLVVFNNTVNGKSCLDAGGLSAAADVTVDPDTRQVRWIAGPNFFDAGSGYRCAPIVTFTPTSPISTQVALQGGGSGYNSPTVAISGGGGKNAAATAVVSFEIANIAVTPGSGYTAPTVTVSGGGMAAGSVTGVAGVGTSAATIPAGSLTALTGYSNPAVSYSGVGAGGVTVSGPGTATVDSTTGAITDIVIPSTASFVSAPLVTVTESGKTAVSFNASVASTAGTITGVTLTPSTALFTSAPAILIADSKGTGATATAALAPTGKVTAINVTNRGTGYSTTPTIAITETGGAGATAIAILSTPTGIGAQAVVTTNNSQSFDVLAKAEQELFDASGRYNSTGGVEIPWTNGLVQTTIPLNYIDTATESLQDGEVQIWKLVDNGFWSNSIHFDMADVQLINRVGWDGTVKPPASNEVGWKDTVRLNPLEDVIVAMRANRTKIPFGLPKSTRALDPSKPLGAAGSGLGFTNGQGTNPPLANRNVKSDGNFDNEFTWGSAILGHAENDFTRPVVFQPTVRAPMAPTALVDAQGAAQGTGMFTWTDATPRGGVDLNGIPTVANPENEVGFKVFKGGVEVARVPANTTRWTDPTPSEATYKVVAFNAAGDSAPSNEVVTQLPVAPTGFKAAATAFNSVALTWDTPKQTTNQLEIWRAVGTGTAVKAVKIAVIGGGVSAFTDNAASAAFYKYSPAVSALETYTYQIMAVNALAPVAGTRAIASADPVKTPMEPVAAPTALTATPNTARTSVALSWTDNANNETEYWVEVSTDGGVTYAAPTKIARTATQKTATGQVTSNVTTLPASGYNFRVTAVNVTGAATSKSAAALAEVKAPPAPTAPAAPTNLTANVTNSTGAVSLSWSAVTPAAGTTITYVVGINDVKLPPQTGRTLNATAQMPLGSVYNVTVVAVATQFGVSATSTTFASTKVDLTAPLAPAVPSGLVATLASLTSANLTWIDNASNETAYLISIARSTTTGTTTTTTTATVNRTATQGTATGGNVNYTATVAAGYSYSFTVTAQAVKFGTTASSAAAGPVTLDVVPPSAPTGVTAVAGAVNSGQISVRWIDAPKSASSYTVQRATVTGGVVGGFNTIGTVAVGVQTFLDTGRTSGRSYQYQVRANGVAGNSAFSTSSTVVAN